MGETNQSETSPSYFGWKVALAGFLGVMGSFAAVVPYTFSLFLKPLTTAFGWHREAVSAGFSIAALTVAAASPGLGFLLDRYGPRRSVLPCIAIFCATYVSLFYLSPRLIHFYLAFFIIGLVGNGTAYLGYSRAISSWFTRRRGVALSIMMAGGSCGAMLFPMIAQHAITNYGWRVAYAVLGILSFILGFPAAALLLKEQSSVARAADKAGMMEGTVRVAVSSRVFWILAITVCLYAASLNGALAHLAALLTDRGVSASGAAYAVAIIGATGLLGRILTGLFLDRFFGVRVSQWMLVLSTFGIILLSFAHTLGTSLVAAAAIGFSMGSEGDITPYLLSRYFGLRRLSTLYALTWTAYAIGGATGPLIVGKLFDSLGSYRPATIQLLAIPSLIPALLMLLLPRYSRSGFPEHSSLSEAASEIPV